MNTIDKINFYHSLIGELSYDHQEGARYVYIKYLSLTREILLCMGGQPEYQHQAALIESINDVINAQLTIAPSAAQREIFESCRKQLTFIVLQARQIAPASLRQIHA